MSYLVLARKYRPRNFSEMVGQDHVVRALSNALETQRLHHAYLFTGTIKLIGQFESCFHCHKYGENLSLCQTSRAVESWRRLPASGAGLFHIVVLPEGFGRLADITSFRGTDEAELGKFPQN